MTKTKLLSLTTTGAVFVSLLFTGVAPTSNVQAASYIKVHYTFKKGNKAFSHKSFKVKENAKVITGLKKGWHVKSTNGFITSIAGRSQNKRKNIYWTYTINGKFASKGAYQQPLHRNDRVVWKLAGIK